jgi:pimeloyl-ACP methyl ester carboxylesterase
MPYFSATRQEIYYRRSGKNATAIVLIHGWYQNGSQAWGKLLPYLENRFQVFVPDLPGHGLTPLVSPENFTTHDNNKLIIEFIRYVKKQYRCRRVILVGHSYGSFAVLSAAAQIPLELAGVIGLAAVDDYAPYTPRLKRVLAISRFLILAYYRLQALLGLFPYGDRMLLYSSSSAVAGGKIPAGLIPGRWAYAKIKNRTLSPANSHAYMRAFIGSRVAWPESKLSLPALLIYGERDVLTASSWAERILPHFKTGSVAVVPKAGHNVQISGAESVGRSISDFIEKPFRYAVGSKDGAHASRRR